nr:hypothetical protein [Thioalkalivibrio sp.]
MTLLLFWTSGWRVASTLVNVAVIEGFDGPSFAVRQALFKPDRDAGVPGTAAIHDIIGSP